jgi:hypothetical protein
VDQLGLLTEPAQQKGTMDSATPAAPSGK